VDPQEPLLWTVIDGPQKVNTVTEDDPHNGGLIEKTINRCLNHTLAGRLIQPGEDEFVSATPEAHRKGDKAYHVKAFRGSKDGMHYSFTTQTSMLTANRIPVFSVHWHLLWFQKAACILPV
jgi:hypothetical protein